MFHLIVLLLLLPLCIAAIFNRNSFGSDDKISTFPRFEIVPAGSVHSEEPLSNSLNLRAADFEDDTGKVKNGNSLAHSDEADVQPSKKRSSFGTNKSIPFTIEHSSKEKIEKNQQQVVPDNSAENRTENASHEKKVTVEITNEQVVRERKRQRQLNNGQVDYAEYEEEEVVEKPKKRSENQQKIYTFDLLEGLADLGLGILKFAQVGIEG